MPIVADVDNDGNAEIVFVENGYNQTPAATQGIQIWGDASDSWVPTRRIWNQHSYHVTNVSETGAIPMNEPPNWLEPTDATVSGRMNNFRQNLPDFDVFAAPDITVALSVNKGSCPAYLGLVATVCNEGALVVGSGIEVKFYDNATMAQIPCQNGPVVTSQPLAPGQCEAVTCQWTDAPANGAAVDIRACADNDGYSCDASSMGGNNECHEDNNHGDKADTSCDPPT
jgi:hypothetical protein